MSDDGSGMTVGDLIDSVSDQLCDSEEGFENQLFSKDKLLSYYNCAVSVTFLGHKESFAETAQYELAPGDCQVLPDCVDAIISIKRIVVNGEESTPSMESEKMAGKNKKLNAFFAGCCDGRSNEPYVAESYSTPVTGGKEFVVQPPIPEGVEASVTANTVIRPEPVTTGEVEDTPIKLVYKAAIFEYMMYMARSSESDSPDQVSLAAQHLDNALKILDMGYRAYARIQAKLESDDSLYWRHSVRGVA